MQDMLTAEERLAYLEAAAASIQHQVEQLQHVQCQLSARHLLEFSEQRSFRQEQQALKRCLIDEGVLREQQLAAALHRKRFDVVRAQHPLELRDSPGLEEAAQAPGLALSFAAAAGPRAAALLAGVSRPLRLLKQRLATLFPLRFCITGGFLDGEALDTVECLDLTAGRWSSLPQMRDRRMRAAAAAMAGKLYVIGGDDGTEVFASVECLNIATGVWSQLRPMKDGRSGAAAAALGGRIYVCGGHDGLEALASVELFDPLGECWTSLPPMGSQRNVAAAAAAGGQLYIFGGDDDVEALASAECFDPAAAAWATLPPMGVRRSRASAAASGGRLFVFGGDDGADALDSAECLDVEDLVEGWAALPPMGCKRRAAAAAAAGGRLYVFGGDHGMEVLASVECFDVGSLGFGVGTWTALPPMASRRTAAAVAVCDSYVCPFEA